MFTGLVEEMGRILRVEVNKETQQVILTIECKVVLGGVQLGDSIAVNGVCLTVTSFTKTQFTAGLSPETIRRTNLGDLKPGNMVNLERSLAANGRLGGHMVQGHVDGTGIIKEFRKEKDSLWVTISASPEIMQYIAEKGYITCDGASLTVCDVTADWFTFMLVQYTQSKIVLPTKKVGQKVNLEVDMIGKHVVKYLAKLGLKMPGNASKL